MQNIWKIIGLMFTLIYIVSCGGSSSGGSSPNPNPPTPTQKSVLLDSVGMIPSINGATTNVSIYIKNNSNVIASGLSYKSTNNLIKITNICNEIAANDSCQLNIQTPSISVGQLQSSDIIQVLADNKVLDSSIVSWRYTTIQNNNNVAITQLPNISQDINRGISAYAYVDGVNGTKFNNFTITANPTNLVSLDYGGNNTEYAPGRIILIRILPTTQTISQLQNIILTPSIDLTNLQTKKMRFSAIKTITGYPVSFQLLPQNTPNVEVSNLSIFNSNITTQNLTLINKGTIQTTVSILEESGNFNVSQASVTLQPNIPQTITISLKPNLVGSPIVNGVLKITGDGANINQNLVYIGNTAMGVPIIIPNINNLWLNTESKFVSLKYDIFNAGNKDLTIESSSLFLYNPSNFLPVSIESNTCITTITPGLSCYVSIRMNIATISTSWLNFLLGVQINYANNTLSSIGYTNITLTNSPILNIAVNPSIINLSGNGIESSRIVFTVTNQIANSITAPLLESFSYPPNSAISIESDNCAGMQLSGNGICSVVFKLGPILLESNNLSGVINYSVSYKGQYNPTESITTLTNSSSYVIFAHDTYLVLESITNNGFMGDGLITNPFSMFGYNSTPLIPNITMKFLNNSKNYAMNNMSINTSSINPLWTIDSASTCGYGTTFIRLESNQSCNLTLNLNREYVAKSATFATSNLNITLPSASWVESGPKAETGVVVQNNIIYGDSSIVYAQYINPMITTIITGNPVIYSNNKTFSLQQTATNINPNGNTLIKISSSIPLFAIGSPAIGNCVSSFESGAFLCTYNATNFNESITYTVDVESQVLPITAPLIFSNQGATGTLSFSPNSVFITESK
jgi:hypothetical protein